MKTVALALFALAFTACSDSSGPGQVGRDSAEAGIFARIGDVPWGSDQGVVDTIGVYSVNGLLRLQGVVPGDRWTHTLSLDLGFSGAFIDSRRAFPLSTTAYYNIAPTAGSLDSMKTYQSLQGRYTVDSYDPATQHLVGTFQFDAVQTGGPDWTDDILPVKNGTFRGFIKVQ